MGKRLFFGFLFALLGALVGNAKLADGESFFLQRGKNIFLAVEKNEEKVVHLAIDLLKRDMKSVLDVGLIAGNRQEAHVIAGTIGQSSLLADYAEEFSSIEGQHEAFLLKVLEDGTLLIAGSDKRGTAYGLLELSRLLGVSPWEWWADATPTRLSSFELQAGYTDSQSPDVPYRGIFINDEDWGLLPWSNQTYEPNEAKNHIGPKTYSRVFELLLRLRANTLWPAMHECTMPFFLVEGNRQAAADYSIFIGSSHCEPMVCNAAGEWSRRGEGAYDYVNNSANVYRFWENRVKEVHSADNIYTLGMRGVHDGKMQGAKTVAEQKAVLERVISDQRGLLGKYVNADVTRVPQVFIPYKEVLDIYRAGLQVPDEVTLMWCDDNYGYIRQFPSAEERLRKGGNGIYYHASYWGRPHDYLWLSTTHPSLLHNEMKRAYDSGIQQMWILNVGDIKPAEYLIELFLDMAWDMDKTTSVEVHLNNFLAREFGYEVAEALYPLFCEYNRLNYIHRPEFLGNTRTEERDPAWKVVKDLPWSERYIRNRLASWEELSDKVEEVWIQVPVSKQDAYFQLVKYPIQGAAQMNEKHLYAQLARHGIEPWSRSDAAYDSIVSLTERYNKGFHNKGKWDRMMDFRPRKLPVFDRVKRDTITESLPADVEPLVVWQGEACKEASRTNVNPMGYEGQAQPIAQGETVEYKTTCALPDTIEVVLHFTPVHPQDGGKLRVEVALDGAEPVVISYETKGRSEEWKENVLWNRATRRLLLPVVQGVSGHRLSVKALDPAIELDCIELFAP